MGILSKKLVDFSIEDIKNKTLVINMLSFEDTLYLSPEGQNILKDYGNNFTSLEGSKIIQKKTLNKFNYSSTLNSLENYRKIFNYYYKSATDYDIDVIKSVYYMRENKCLFYKNKKLEIGEIIPNVKLFNLNGTNVTSIYDVLNEKKFNYCVIAAFSMS